MKFFKSTKPLILSSSINFSKSILSLPTLRALAMAKKMQNCLVGKCISFPSQTFQKFFFQGGGGGSRDASSGSSWQQHWLQHLWWCGGGGGASSASSWWWHLLQDWCWWCWSGFRLIKGQFFLLSFLQILLITVLLHL